MTDQRTPALVEYGLTTTVLGTGWKLERFTRRVLGDMPPEVRAAWWKRTDYAWRCSACPRKAGVMYKTLGVAKKAAEKHGSEHPGVTVKEI